MFAEALDILASKDVFAAVEFLTGHDDSLAVVNAFADLARHFYNDRQDLHHFVMVSLAGIQAAMSAARTSDSDTAYELRSRAKGLSYNLAANTWRGWDEPGIVIDPAQEQIGLDAARANLRLAVDLNKGDLPHSRAYWILGAQQISARQYVDAERSFELAHEYARKAEKPDEVLLADGFGELVILLQEPGNAEAETRLAQIKAELRPMPDGEFFVGQLDTAQRVFAVG